MDVCAVYELGSKVKPRTFGCVAMGSAFWCILCPDCLDILACTWCKFFVWI